MEEFIFRELTYILASLRGSTLCLYSGCYGGAAVFRDFVYILASLRGGIICLYSGCYGGAALFSDFLPIIWRCCRAASFVHILADTEEWLSSVTFAYNLALLRGSILCLYSGCYGGAAVSPDFVSILASLQGSNLCLYSGCYGGAAVFPDVIYILASLRGQQPLSIFWLLRWSSCLP